MTSALFDFVFESVWALHPQVHAALCQLVEGHRATGEELAKIQAARAMRTEHTLPSTYENRGGIGYVPISGVIARHSRQVNGESQPHGTSLEQLRGDLQAALADKDAHSIVLAIDSPGGSVDGLVDAAEEIREARKVKRIEAHVAGRAASAAYWLGSQAHKMHATRGSEVGSIGVFTGVADTRRRYEAAGVEMHYVQSVPGKVGAGAPGRAVSAHDVNALQLEVDAWHERFVDAVAAGRGVSRDVAAKWGDARMHTADAAKAIGLIDGVRSEAEVMESLRARGRATAKPNEGRTMNATNEATPATVETPRTGTPTSANDLRGAYPEAVAQIERDAVSRERERVAEVATACEGQSPSVVDVGLKGIASGDPASKILAGMLRAAPKVSAPASFTAQAVSASPTIETMRAAASENKPLGAAPPKEKLTVTQWKERWAAMPAEEQKADFCGEWHLFVACKRHEGVVI